MGIQFEAVTKDFGDRRAMDAVSFECPPGTITGLLGPNGSGKTTALRILLGLERADSGRATFDGLEYRELRQPLRSVGALLDAGWAHPHRSAEAHLRSIALTDGISRDRVFDTLFDVGLADVSHLRVSAFSLGMRQRLGLAAALLGEPSCLILDEPINGLDPDGILWLRDLLRDAADRGATVLLSTHIISELALSVDRVVVLGRGRVLAENGYDELLAAHRRPRVLVESERLADLRRLLPGAVRISSDVLAVSELTSASVGRIAAEHGIAVTSLTTDVPSLEDVYRTLTAASREFSNRA